MECRLIERSRGIDLIERREDFFKFYFLFFGQDGMGGLEIRIKSVIAIYKPTQGKKRTEENFFLILFNSNHSPEPYFS